MHDDRLPDSQLVVSPAHRLDPPGDLVTDGERPRIGNRTVERAVDEVQVGATHAAALDSHNDVIGLTEIGWCDVLKFQGRSVVMEAGGFHGYHQLT
jgi:hypothetical protein